MASIAARRSEQVDDRRRREILDAAHRCVERFGVRRTRMDDVAELAGVSRPLLYRYFSNRRELIDAVLLDGVRTVAQKLSPRIAKFETFAEAVVEGSILLVRAGREKPLLSAGAAAGATPRISELPETIRRHSDHIREMAVAVWEPVHARARARGEIRSSIDESELSDWLACVHLMFLLRPDLDEDQMRSYLRTFVVPSLVP